MIVAYKSYRPTIDETCYISHSADIVGDVTLHKQASVWFGAVIRGDVNRVEIGENSNVQDNAIIHEADDYPCIIGKNVTIGHGAIVHACTVEDNVLIGMNAVILDGAHIERDVIIGAGALVTGKKRIARGSLVLGSPAKVVRALNQQEIASIAHSAEKYVAKADQYKQNGDRS